MVKKIFANIYVYFILFLMYLPILVLIAFSFSTNSTIAIGEAYNPGFDLYINLFSDTQVAREIWTAVGNTLIIAVISAMVSVVLGTLGAIGTFYCKRKAQKSIEVVTQIPVVNAEIVIALSLTVMFVFLGTYVFHAKLFSFWTLLIGHVVLSLPFVYLSVKPKLMQMDPSLYEAALDLGAKPSQGLRKIIIPQIMPGIFSGFLLSITLSLDDYIVTEFTRGPGLLSGDAAIETLSTYIQTSLKKHAVPAELRPLTLIIFLTVLAIVIGITLYRTYKSKTRKVAQ
jgi:spermidine/putrescine transport system permease protein